MCVVCVCMSSCVCVSLRVCVSACTHASAYESDVFVLNMTTVFMTKVLRCSVCLCLCVCTSLCMCVCLCVRARD